MGFHTTHWTVVLAARGRDGTLAQDALASLCTTYWYPLYAFIRRRGSSPHEAEDLTQEFFHRFLERNGLANVQPAAGKFRSFLLACLKNFLSNERERARTQRRGGAHGHISWDQASAEDRYRIEPVSDLSPEKVFERRWALTLFQEALLRLRDECAAQGKGELFTHLKNFLTDDPKDGAYAEVAGALKTSSGAVAVAVHRLRQRYGELVREEIAHTVSTPEEIQEELRYLISLVAK